MTNEWQLVEEYTETFVQLYKEKNEGVCCYLKKSLYTTEKFPRTVNSWLFEQALIQSSSLFEAIFLPRELGLFKKDFQLLKFQLFEVNSYFPRRFK